jgi:hypothetical protein
MPAATRHRLRYIACMRVIGREHIVAVDLDGVAVRTLDLEGLLKTTQTARHKDRADRAVRNRRCGRSVGARRHDADPRARLRRTVVLGHEVPSGPAAARTTDHRPSA